MLVDISMSLQDIVRINNKNHYFSSYNYIYVEIRRIMDVNNVIPTEKRIERLQYENPWWTTSEV